MDPFDQNDNESEDLGDFENVDPSIRGFGDDPTGGPFVAGEPAPTVIMGAPGFGDAVVVQTIRTTQIISQVIVPSSSIPGSNLGSGIGSIGGNQQGAGVSGDQFGLGSSDTGIGFGDDTFDQQAGDITGTNFGSDLNTSDLGTPATGFGGGGLDERNLSTPEVPSGVGSTFGANDSGFGESDLGQQTPGLTGIGGADVNVGDMDLMDMITTPAGGTDTGNLDLGLGLGSPSGTETGNLGTGFGIGSTPAPNTGILDPGLGFAATPESGISRGDMGGYQSKIQDITNTGEEQGITDMDVAVDLSTARGQ